jgi:hypothetical protein
VAFVAIRVDRDALDDGVDAFVVGVRRHRRGLAGGGGVRVEVSNPEGGVGGEPFGVHAVEDRDAAST